MFVFSIIKLALNIIGFNIFVIKLLLVG